MTNILHKQKYVLIELQDIPRLQISPEIQIHQFGLHGSTTTALSKTAFYTQRTTITFQS